MNEFVAAAKAFARRIAIAGVLAAALPASYAGAAVVTYELSGSRITDCTEQLSGLGGKGICGAFLGASADGSFSIDESALAAGTLVSQSVSFGSGPFGQFASLEGLDWSGMANSVLSSFTFPTVSSMLRLETDQFRNPLSYSIAILDGPPDYFIGSGPQGSGFFIEAGNASWSGDAGRLALASVTPAPAPIPLPATGLLLLGGLALLGAVRSRRAKGGPRA